MMDKLITHFPLQLVESLDFIDTFNMKPHVNPIRLVYIAGMGGSGIGGDFVAKFVQKECKIPIVVGKSYEVPAYIDNQTAVLVSSYSGNTEETLTVLEAVQKTGAKIICISSGGRIMDIAKAKGYDTFTFPKGFSSPRACLGYSIVYQLIILNKLGLIDSSIFKSIRGAVDLLKYDQDDIVAKAQQMANSLYGKIPVIYTESKLEPVALRWRQQINENAKMLCWHHVIPEMNHNELVGWKNKRDELAVIFLRNKSEHRRNAFRMEITTKIISRLCDTVLEVPSKGTSLIEKAFYFIHLGDWVSWYLSRLNGVDAIEIDIIDYLKKELSNI